MNATNTNRAATPRVAGTDYAETPNMPSPGGLRIDRRPLPLQCVRFAVASVYAVSSLPLAVVLDVAAWVMRRPDPKHIRQARWTTRPVIAAVPAGSQDGPAQPAGVPASTADAA